MKSLPSKKMDTVEQVQILDEAVCISHCANTFGKGMNPIISLQLWAIEGQAELFNLGMATGLED